MSNPSTYRRTVAGLALIAAPLLLLISTLVTPGGENTEGSSEYMRNVAADPGGHELGTVFAVLAFAAFVPAFVGCIHLLRHRAVALGHIFGTFALIGAVMFVALASTTFYDVAIAENLPLDQAIKVNEGVEDVAAAGIVLIPALLGILIGSIGLGVAMWRGGWAPAWVPAAIVVGMLLVIAGDGSKALEIVSSLVLLAGWGFLGVKLLGMGNDAWERAIPPGDDRAAAEAPAAAPAPAAAG